MKNQKGFVVPLLLAIIAVLVVGGGIYIYNNKKVEEPVALTNTGADNTNQVQQQKNIQTPLATNNSTVQNPSPEISVNDVSSLQFTYGSDVFKLKEVSSNGINIYEFRAGNTSTIRVYNFMPNDPTAYTQGILGGVDTKLFILWRGSGANIIEPILFAFRKNGDAWKQIAYTKLSPDDGRTMIENFSVANESIVLNVKTSGPDRNYHEVYVPKQYVYKLSGGKLLLQ